MAELKGADELKRWLELLTKQTQGKSTRSALRKAANGIKKAAQNNAQSVDDPATRENIVKNIAVRFDAKGSRRSGNVVMKVGVMGGAKNYANTTANVRSGRAGQSYKTAGSKTNPGGDTWYWRFIEFGTEKMQAQPFLRPALADNVDQAISTFAAELDKQITKTIAKGVK